MIDIIFYIFHFIPLFIALFSGWFFFLSLLLQTGACTLCVAHYERQRIIHLCINIYICFLLSVCVLAICSNVNIFMRWCFFFVFAYILSLLFNNNDFFFHIFSFCFCYVLGLGSGLVVRVT